MSQSTSQSLPQIDSREFRNALGQFATGVTIITTRDSEGHPAGMTANSFSSLSLDPALVLWSIAKTSSNYAVFAEAKSFAIHVLNSEQQAASGQFARKDIDRFESINTEENTAGTPLLTDYLTRFECTTEHRYEGGDHLIIVGRVNNFDAKKGEPLLFFKGNFEQLSK